MHLTNFESAVYRRDVRAALTLLPPMLRVFAQEGMASLAVPPPPRWGPVERSGLATRVATAIGALLLDPEFKLPKDDLFKVMRYGRWLDLLFTASFFGTADSFLREMFERGGPSQVRPTHLLLLSLGSELEIPTDFLRSLPPDIRWDVTLRLLETKIVTSERATERKRQLLETCDDLVPPIPATFIAGDLVRIANAGMLASYASSKGKHRIKGPLAESARRVMQAGGIHDAPLPEKRAFLDRKSRGERPVMVVASEMMHGRHVQFRYFGQWLRQLRKEFRLVLVTEAREADAAARALFDETFTFDRDEAGEHLRQARDAIVKFAPDILFYPSVGMRHWGVGLASLRLAPIQVTALGHSASTFCPTIDYYVIEQGYVSDPSLFSEKVVLLPDSALVFEPMMGAAIPKAVAPKAPGTTVRIAIPSNAMKLSHAFLKAVKRVCDEAKTKVEVHFFPNVSGLEEDALRRTLAEWFPNLRVSGVLVYEAYIEELKKCDVMLSPFPFGGLHSVVDGVRVGLPIVALEGAEPHSRTDSTILRLLDLSEGQVHTTEDAYVAQALALVDDVSIRTAASRRALAVDVDARLFGDAEASRSGPVLDAFLLLLNEHEQMLASNQKAWSVGQQRGCATATQMSERDVPR